ncbi:DEAD-box ATP-dependent RNA helicase 5-like [Zingiber officinale]|uniref:DEAD-box ATP-dependent RNA helicase 5-like n=1 Tax=Zingiber officinale TaxID=94328 RepID=UPI001C4B289E|nr:DEAD-box ATP-dependent RNA helicase 5-like [Zingiber officinale]
MGRTLDAAVAVVETMQSSRLDEGEKDLAKKSKTKNKREKSKVKESNSRALREDEIAAVDSPANGHNESVKNKKKKKRKAGDVEIEFDPPQEAEQDAQVEKINKVKKKRESEKGAHFRVETASKVNKERKQVEEEGGKKGVEVEQGPRVSGSAIVSGNNTSGAKYKALSSFSETGLPAQVLDCCKSFSKPSPIQSHSWPFLLDGRDLIGIAATGSGKTLAFGVPALMHILRIKNGKESKRTVPRCLVLSPTRELAQQISDVLSDAGTPSGTKSVCLYGGTSKGPQIASLKSGVDIVIGTPGRMKDLIEMGICQLKEVTFVVLDEADRMLDMGFEPEVRSILSQTSSTRQMVMFSATWPFAVHQLAKEFMDPNPVKVVVGSEDLSANHDVMQIVEVLDDHSRDSRLVSLLEKYHQSQRNRVLVFVLYKKEAARVENMLQNKGWKVVSVHGDKAQHDRTKSLCLFKEGTCPLMIATDVASRGLDIPDVEVVINYSFPLTTEDYVHRIGRTGRAGKKGVAHTFFTKENKGLAGELVNVLREAGQTVPVALTNFGTHVKKKESKLYGAHFKEITADAPKSTKITFSNSDDED